MFTIENQQLKVTIHPKGAELQSIFHKGQELEYMWGGDPAFWGKHSPVLFPIVGTIKEDTYYYENKAYKLARHGFAREMEFEVEKQEPGNITFLLRSNDDTLKKYPFAFELRVIYGLTPDGLKTTYSVKNVSAGDMYFSVGGHPAFKVPLVQGTNYNDYFLEFEKEELLSRWPISGDGLIEKHPVTLSQHDRVLPLTKELFAADALVFKHLSSRSVALRSARTDHGLHFDFSGFPYLGIWAAKNADFVCIEPWCGIADSVDADQQLIDKEGINRLAPGAGFERTWTLSVF
jgi:galactose mutarotase-like enzyme